MSSNPGEGEFFLQNEKREKKIIFVAFTDCFISSSNLENQIGNNIHRIGRKSVNQSQNWLPNPIQSKQLGSRAPILEVSDKWVGLEQMEKLLMN